MVLPLVRPTIGAIDKGALAEGAFVRPQSRVNDQMVLERLVALKELRTDLTLVPPLIRVHLHVARERVAGVEHDPALWTDPLLPLLAVRLYVGF